MSRSAPPQRLELQRTPLLTMMLAFVAVLLALPLGTQGRFTLLFFALGLVAIDVVLGRLGLARLQARVCEPGTAFAWEAFPVALRVENRGRFWTGRDLMLSHAASGHQRSRLFAYRPGLRPGQGVDLRARHKLPRRGRYRSYQLTISSAFPFGLVAWHAHYELEADFLALPRMGELHNPDRLLPLLTGADFGHVLNRDGNEEFYALRRWREGMSQRKVHWKASARQQRLLVREDLPEERPRVHVQLLCGLDGDNRRQRQSFEQAVSCTATLVAYLLRERVPVRLRLDRADGPTDLAPVGRPGLHAVLASLAEIQPHHQSRRGNAMSLSAHAATVVVTARPLQSAPGRTMQVPVPSSRTRVVLDLSRPEARKYYRHARALPMRLRLADPVYTT